MSSTERQLIHPGVGSGADRSHPVPRRLQVVTGFVVPAACETVTDWLAMVSVAVRAAPVLADAENITVPGPEPLLPLVMVMKPDAEAVQAHPAGAVTPTLRPVFAAALMLTLVRESVIAHG